MLHISPAKIIWGANTKLSWLMYKFVIVTTADLLQKPTSDVFWEYKRKIGKWQWRFIRKVSLNHAHTSPS